MQSSLDIADYQWLTSDEAVEVLALASDSRSSAEFSPVRLATKLRKSLSPSRARLVQEQIELRLRAREKFSRADRMFFMPIGLEQATDEWIACYKAERFTAAGPNVDLCCGLGGDAIGLAQRGPVVAVDRDEVAVVLCEANLRECVDQCESALPPFRVQQADVAAAEPLCEIISGASAWHIDPDRRPAGRRTTRVELHEPGIEAIQSLRQLNPSAAIKLSPATTLEGNWWEEAELEWISRARQCRQLVAWFGRLARDVGKRRATIVFGTQDGMAAQSESFFGEPGADCPHADRVGRFVFEPDAAVLAADLQGSLAVEHGLAAIAFGVEYFTADQPVGCALLSCFEVLDTIPLDVKRLKAWLKARQIGRVEVKKRGVPIEPAQLARQLSGPGAEVATILLARIAGRVTAIVGKRRSY